MPIMLYNFHWPPSKLFFAIYFYIIVRLALSFTTFTTYPRSTFVDIPVKIHIVSIREFHKNEISYICLDFQDLNYWMCNSHLLYGCK